jgi:hypothetical protein
MGQATASLLSTATLRERIAQLQAEARRPDADAEDLLQLTALAAVQSSYTHSRLFEDAGLRPTANLRQGLRDLSLQLDGPGDDQESMLWQLEPSARRHALRRLGSQDAIRAARARARPPHDDAAQRVFDALLLGSLPPLAQLGHDELAALLVVGEWLDGSPIAVPPLAGVRAQLARERLVQPMRRLVGEHFVGRQAELSTLADYVGVLPPDKLLASRSLGAGRRFVRQVWHSLRERPPLFVAGPGGVGKSSLLAQFILSHLPADQAQTLPFVFLDFDRAQVDSAEPFTLLIEALRQLRVQFPEHEATLDRVAREIGWRVARRDAAELSKSDALQEDLVIAFARALEGVFGGESNPTPLLWVLDTFEEPQRRGESTVGALWSLMNTLQRQLPRLRLVVSGRVVPRGFIWEPVELPEFDAASAAAYLRTRLKEVAPEFEPAATVLETITEAVGRTPLALRMAARIIANEGIQSLKSLAPRRILFFTMRSDQIQAQLFHRVLEHISIPDPHLEPARRQQLTADLRRLAYPGLAVRRLTPEVILKVLARPCGLALRTMSEAADLYQAMRRQVDIVEPDDLGGALIHRSDVRRLMLRDLQETAGPKLGQIDRRAARYYSTQPGVRDRAEEIYHRMRLHETQAKLDARWQPGVERYLLSALDEVSDGLKVYLAEKLGVTLSAEALQRAEQSDWERQSQRRVQEYLTAGEPRSALAVLRERAERARNSPLLRLEAETLRLLGEQEQAAGVAARALDEALGVGARSDAIEMTLLLTVIEEARGHLAAATDYAGRARQWAAQTGRALESVRASVALLRLARKSGRVQPAALQAERAETLRRIDTDLLRQLVPRPALQRELLAELGADSPRLLRLGLQSLGIDLQDEAAAHDFASLLAGWAGPDDAAHAATAAADVAAAHGVTTQDGAWPGTQDWLAWLHRSSPREIGALAAALLHEAPPGVETLAAIAAHFQQDAEQRITRSRRSRLL